MKKWWLERKESKQNLDMFLFGTVQFVSLLNLFWSPDVLKTLRYTKIENQNYLWESNCTIAQNDRNVHLKMYNIFIWQSA